MKNLLLLVAFGVLLTVPVQSQIRRSRPSQLSADTLQRINKATPAALPQTGKRKETSDAQDDRLKGRVKSVTVEEEDLSGTWETQGRHFSAISEFDERGDLLRRVNFGSDGIPYEVQAWGYIDGFRAEKSNPIERADTDTGGPPPAQRNPAIPRKKPDDRYSWRYEYTYSNGELVEVQMTLSNDEPGNRVTYERNGNEVKKMVYDSQRKFNRGYRYIFDSNGNEIEIQEITNSTFRSRRGETTQYKYQSFDKNGNWTKRITLKPAIENGKEFYKPWYATYRTIAYYK